MQETVLQMADPPPYVAYAATVSSSTASIPRLLARHVSPNDYPKLCRVSSAWNTVFQPLLWSQPDRFFTTQQRSANRFQKFVHAFYAARPQVTASIIHLSLHNVYESVYISLPTDFLRRLLTSSPRLKSLDLSPGFLISSLHITAVRTFHHNLTTLSLAGVQAFSTTTLPQFLSFFPRLTRLDLSGTNGVNPSLTETLPLSHLSALRLRHQPFKINDSTVLALAQGLHSKLAELDLSFALGSITIKSIDAIDEYCQARPPIYSSNIQNVDIGPGPRKLGLAYTSIPLSAISRLISSEMIHLTALDVAGIRPLSFESVAFWQTLRSGGSFHSLEAIRIEYTVFSTWNTFDMYFFPPRLHEFSIHNVPATDSGGVILLLTCFLADLRLNPFLVLRTLNLEMAPKEHVEGVGMYAVDEVMVDEVDVVEEIKRWKRLQREVWGGQIRVVRDVVGSRDYAQEFGSGVGDILGRW